MQNAIEVDQLGKAYRSLGAGVPTLYKTLSRLIQRRPVEYFWALQNVSFAIPKGATVGVIGPNGSGKSSLLGLIAGTVTPTTGTVRAEGRISSLLELGAGFHPELSGRENAILNASILGIPREDVIRRMDHIIEFAGLREFIDAPVKHYSSGMYVRLGFAVAVEINPDILLIDEVLAVGDIAFQTKCLERIRELQKRGKTLLLVSHALETVQQFCDDTLLILDGKLAERGPPKDAIFTYLKTYMLRLGKLHVEEFGTRQITIDQIVVKDHNDQETTHFQSGTAMQVEIHYTAHERIETPVFGFGIKSADGTHIFGSNTMIEGQSIKAVQGSGIIRLRIEPLILRQGNFFLSLSCHSPDHQTQYHRLEDWLAFSVDDTTDRAGIMHLPNYWDVTQTGGTGNDC
jgi:ABC-type polysaccharide/polyol phosphate transport system ATPase subunit